MNEALAPQPLETQQEVREDDFEDALPHVGGPRQIGFFQTVREVPAGLERILQVPFLGLNKSFFWKNGGRKAKYNFRIYNKKCENLNWPFFYGGTLSSYLVHVEELGAPLQPLDPDEHPHEQFPDELVPEPLLRLAVELLQNHETPFVFDFEDLFADSLGRGGQGHNFPVVGPERRVQRRPLGQLAEDLRQRRLRKKSRRL